MHVAEPSPGSGSGVREARLELGWTHDELAAEVARIRTRRRMPSSPPDSLRRQVIAIQQGTKRAGPLWRSLLCEALDTSEERLFGLVLDAELPRPMLANAAVTTDVIDAILARRHVHARAEHLFGPRHAQQLVAADMSTIAQLVQATGRELRRDVRRAAALVAELGGWIAQDSGDSETALALTREADAYARNAEPAVRAMILMRQANILTRRDPGLSADMAADAAELVSYEDVGLLPAAIARQQAIAALAMGDLAAFGEHASTAAHLATADQATDDLANYATPAYIASETVPGLLVAGEHEAAIELLTPHMTRWPGAQQRDHAVAALRLLRAHCTASDYRSALSRCEHAISAWRVAPSARARNELRLVRKLLHDRARSDRGLPITELRRRIDAAIAGDPDHG